MDKDIYHGNLKKSVTIVSAIFPPEPVVSAQTSADIAKSLVANGNDVTVITAFPSRPAGKLYSGYKRRIFKKEISEDGYQVIRSFATLSPESSLVSRLLENISFGITSGLALLFTSKANVLYLNTWPVFAAGIAALIARFRDIPYVLSVQDLYPESLITQQRISDSGTVVRFLKWVDSWVARGANTIIVISPRFQEIYINARGIEAEKIQVIQNWINPIDVQLDVDDLAFRQKVNVPHDGLLVTYAGNIGAAAGVEAIIEQFNTLNTDKIYLMIAGDGPLLAKCRSAAAGNSRIFFHSPWPKEETSIVLRASDLFILPTLGKQSLVSVPSKLISYMIAARPVLAIALPDSETVRMIEAANCGWNIHPKEVDKLGNLLLQILSTKRSMLSAKGKLGRAYALAHLTSDVCLPQVISLIENAAAN